MGNSFTIGDSFLWQPALGVDHDGLEVLPGLAQGAGQSLAPEREAGV